MFNFHACIPRGQLGLAVLVMFLFLCRSAVTSVKLEKNRLKFEKHDGSLVELKGKVSFDWKDTKTDNKKEFGAILKEYLDLSRDYSGHRTSHELRKKYFTKEVVDKFKVLATRIKELNDWYKHEDHKENTDPSCKATPTYENVDELFSLLDNKCKSMKDVLASMDKNIVKWKSTAICAQKGGFEEQVVERWSVYDKGDVLTEIRALALEKKWYFWTSKDTKLKYADSISPTLLKDLKATNEYFELDVLPEKIYDLDVVAAAIHLFISRLAEVQAALKIDVLSNLFGSQEGEAAGSFDLGCEKDLVKNSYVGVKNFDNCKKLIEQHLAGKDKKWNLRIIMNKAFKLFKTVDWDKYMSELDKLSSGGDSLLKDIGWLKDEPTKKRILALLKGINGEYKSDNFCKFSKNSYTHQAPGPVGEKYLTMSDDLDYGQYTQFLSTPQPPQCELDPKTVRFPPLDFCLDNKEESKHFAKIKSFDNGQNSINTRNTLMVNDKPGFLSIIHKLAAPYVTVPSSTTAWATISALYMGLIEDDLYVLLWGLYVWMVEPRDHSFVEMIMGFDQECFRANKLLKQADTKANNICEPISDYLTESKSWRKLYENSLFPHGKTELTVSKFPAPNDAIKQAIGLQLYYRDKPTTIKKSDFVKSVPCWPDAVLEPAHQKKVDKYVKTGLRPEGYEIISDKCDLLKAPKNPCPGRGFSNLGSLQYLEIAEDAISYFIYQAHPSSFMSTFSFNPWQKRESKEARCGHPLCYGFEKSDAKGVENLCFFSKKIAVKAGVDFPSTTKTLHDCFLKIQSSLQKVQPAGESMWESPSKAFTELIEHMRDEVGKSNEKKNIAQIIIEGTKAAAINFYTSEGFKIVNTIFDGTKYEEYKEKETNDRVKADIEKMTNSLLPKATELIDNKKKDPKKFAYFTGEAKIEDFLKKREILYPGGKTDDASIKANAKSYAHWKRALMDELGYTIAILNNVLEESDPAAESNKVLYRGTHTSLPVTTGYIQIDPTWFASTAMKLKASYSAQFCTPGEAETLLVISGHSSGKDIMKYSTFGNEAEVLFGQGAVFYIVDQCFIDEKAKKFVDYNNIPTSEYCKNKCKGVIEQLNASGSFLEVAGKGDEKEEKKGGAGGGPPAPPKAPDAPKPPDAPKAPIVVKPKPPKATVITEFAAAMAARKAKVDDGEAADIRKKTLKCYVVQQI